VVKCVCVRLWLRFSVAGGFSTDEPVNENEVCGSERELTCFKCRKQAAPLPALGQVLAASNQIEELELVEYHFIILYFAPLFLSGIESGFEPKAALSHCHCPRISGAVAVAVVRRVVGVLGSWLAGAALKSLHSLHSESLVSA